MNGRGKSNLEFKLKALTDIWTGDVNGKSDKLLLTGIRGSLRWWYEALIRGLGSYACDPSDKTFDSNNKIKRCGLELSYDEKNKIKSGDIRIENLAKEKICPACYLFGCSGWSSKFILRIYKFNDPATVQYEKISAGTRFSLEFIETKKLEPVEETLIKMLIKLIVDYGAIGGKTAFKPSEIALKNYKLHHKDFGIIERLKDCNSNNISNIPVEKIYHGQKEKISEYLKNFNKKENDSEWPDLNNFWFANNCSLNRKEINDIVKRNSNYPKSYHHDAENIHKWIGGNPASRNESGISKKIFSFHGLDSNGENVVFTPRCFGYAKAGQLDNIIALVEKAVPYLKGKFKKREDILNEL